LISAVCAAVRYLFRVLRSLYFSGGTSMKFGTNIHRESLVNYNNALCPKYRNSYLCLCTIKIQSLTM